VVVVRIGQHATLEGRCIVLTRGAHTKIWIDSFTVALAGRDYFTVVGMLRQLQSSLSHCTVKSNHLSQVWAWKELMGHPCTRGMRNLDPAHAFRFERSGGIYAQWKQWCTDESWGKNILLVPGDQISTLGLFRPACLDMAFPSGGQPILEWINHFEARCASQPVGKYKELQNEFAWLREIVHHTVLGEYNPGTQVDILLADLRGCLNSAMMDQRHAMLSPWAQSLTCFLGLTLLPSHGELAQDRRHHTYNKQEDAACRHHISRQLLVGQGPQAFLCME
jgi:hypothetical protein